MGILLAIEIVVFLFLHIVARRTYKTLLATAAPARVNRWNRWTPAFLWLLDRLALWRQASPWTVRLHHLHTALAGPLHSLTETKLSAARMAMCAYLCVLSFTGLSCLAEGKWEVAALGLIGAALSPFVQLRMLQEKLQARRRSMLLALPELVNQVLLLTNAGETVQQALLTCVDRERDDRERPLLYELRLAAGELKLNVSLTKALDDMQKRCCLQEVTLFVSTILLNYKRGGDDLSVALRTLSKELWEKRKALTRTMGEEASSKLVFPMVLIFVAVLMIVASPAVMLMNAN